MTDGSASSAATAATARGVPRVYDASALRDGRSTHHCAGRLGFTPHDEQSGP